MIPQCKIYHNDGRFPWALVSYFWHRSYELLRCLFFQKQQIVTTNQKLIVSSSQKPDHLCQKTAPLVVFCTFEGLTSSFPGGFGDVEEEDLGATTTTTSIPTYQPPPTHQLTTHQPPPRICISIFLLIFLLEDQVLCQWNLSTYR